MYSFMFKHLFLFVAVIVITKETSELFSTFLKTDPKNTSVGSRCFIV